MPGDSGQRRLTAILAADIVGYSRLISVDDVGTLAHLKSLRTAAIDPAIAEQHGRIVKETGDGLLVEFPSVLDAVQCAIDIQTALPRLQAETPDEKRIVYRIGINLGDIISEGGDIFGDGINIAARLEAIAEPGEIWVSEPVANQVENRISQPFEDLGFRELKNIAKPVRVFRLRLESAAGAAPGPRKTVTGWPIAIAALFLIGVIAAVAFMLVPTAKDQPEPVEPANVADMALPLPERPSIAVLPFENLSDDPVQGYFADGITDDLITDLSKVSGLFVINRNSVFAYKDKAAGIAEVAEDLGVRYVLEGSVRRADDRIRINAQLIDATTGGHLWADRYDGVLGDIFTLQDQVTRQIVAVLSVQLTQAEETEIGQRSTGSAIAYDEFLKGWDQYLRQTPESFKAALDYFERAVEIDPDFGRAHAARAATYWQISRRFWHPEFGFRSFHDARAKAEELLAVAQREPTALAHQVATAMLSQQGWHEEALAAGARAIGIDPNDADSYVALAGALSLAGRPGEAARLVRKAMRLNPRFPADYFYQLGLAEFGLGRFDAAADALEKATALNPDDRFSYRVLLATYGQQDRVAEAERILEGDASSWLGHDPLTVRATTFWFPFKEKEDRDRFVAGLRAAGLPE